jgi:hypothetical protein
MEGIEEKTYVVDEDGTQKVYAKCEELLATIEEVLEQDGAFKGAEAKDRVFLVSSPLFLALFEQMKHRYRENMDPSVTVLMVAAIVRNFANSDGLSETALSDAVQSFLHFAAERDRSQNVEVSDGE